MMTAIVIIKITWQQRAWQIKSMSLLNVGVFKCRMASCSGNCSEMGGGLPSLCWNCFSKIKWNRSFQNCDYESFLEMRCLGMD